MAECGGCARSQLSFGKDILKLALAGEIGPVVGKRNLLAVDGSPIPTKSSPPSDAGTKALDSIHNDDWLRDSLNLIPDWNVRP
jgi:hypothetical protein